MLRSFPRALTIPLATARERIEGVRPPRSQMEGNGGAIAPPQTRTTGKAICAFPSCPCPILPYPATSDSEKINHINKKTGHRVKIAIGRCRHGRRRRRRRDRQGLKSGDGYIEIIEHDLEAIEVE